MNNFLSLLQKSEIQDVEVKEKVETEQLPSTPPRTIQEVVTSILGLLAIEHQQSIYRQLLEMEKLLSLKQK